MIDRNLFQQSREAARRKLPSDEAKHSFGYHIDYRQDWDNVTPEQLAGYLSIHRTHTRFDSEIVEDLGLVRPGEREWAERYLQVIENVAKQLSPNGHREDVRYDINETIFDWRTILKFAKLPARILDYGAGCGRQGVSAFLRDPTCVYVAVDSTLAGYTAQNLVLKELATMAGAVGPLYEFLERKRVPCISNALAGDIYHVPAWELKENLPSRYFDVMIASHVHNELSGPDFMRMIDAVDKGLANDGIFYVRSEMRAFNTPKEFSDKGVIFHGLDPVSILKERGIYPVYCKNESAFLTTVFARASNHPWRTPLPVSTSRELSLMAADEYVRRHLHGVAMSGKRVLIVNAAFPYVGRAVDIVLPLIENKLVLRDFELWMPGGERSVHDFQPEIVVIASRFCERIKEKIKGVLDTPFPLSRRYWHPVIIMYSQSALNRDSYWVTPKLGPEVQL